MTQRPPWYGGNKIPDSYLKKFLTAVEDEGIPHDLRIFLNQLTKETPNASREKPHEAGAAAV